LRRASAIDEVAHFNCSNTDEQYQNAWLDVILIHGLVNKPSPQHNFHFYTTSFSEICNLSLYMQHYNHLINETSPYLLQHAHNPVQWYPWGDEALQKAKDENKPILVSIGYAACHWCHVMERESFEDEATAAIMNKYFINIKIDREERPDLDHIYMDAVQAMTGSGGWPLNCFLTPVGKPFYGGTYFPPKPAYNRPSWQDTLLGVAKAFSERRHEIDAQAENLTEHLLQSNSFGVQKVSDEEIFIPSAVDEAANNILKSADTVWGGFGKAPKFPQTFCIQFLLRYTFYQQEPSTTKEASLSQAILSLDKMIEGGIYDQVGGGFARYSTDSEWLAPHFEKMLYDNALFVSVLSEAYQLTKKERYMEVIDETIEFVQRELMHPLKGFYAALDADSEGVEGKFYVWQKDEIQKLLGDDAELFCEYYDVTEQGNWEHSNILRVKKPVDEFAQAKNKAAAEIKSVLDKGKTILLAERNKRTRPLLDDKVILGWNVLMNTACCKAFAATSKEDYRQLAIDNMHFLLQHLETKEKNRFYHTWKNDQAKNPAFLDDYAFLIQALQHVHEITADTKWLVKAKEITEFAIKHFSEEDTPFFFYTPAGQHDVIIRKKEVYDGAVPSGNSVMAYNLYQLSIFFDIPAWRQQASDMVASLGKAIARYPTSFANWACLLQEIVKGTDEMVIMGGNNEKLHGEILAYYHPHKVMMMSVMPNAEFPLLHDKKIINEPSVYLCRNNTCFPPVFSLRSLISLINRAKNQ
jgi:uncharacterized protein